MVYSILRAQNEFSKLAHIRIVVPPPAPLPLPASPQLPAEQIADLTETAASSEVQPQDVEQKQKGAENGEGTPEQPQLDVERKTAAENKEVVELHDISSVPQSTDVPPQTSSVSTNEPLPETQPTGQSSDTLAAPVVQVQPQSVPVFVPTNEWVSLVTLPPTYIIVVGFLEEIFTFRKHSASYNHAIPTNTVPMHRKCK